MSLAIVYTRASIGMEAPLVTVETHLSNGLPSFSMVGLPETAVKESKERVRSAIINSRLEFPAKRITVNLAPADLPKGGGGFDLAIAVGILLASGQLRNVDVSRTEFMGELALSGELRGVRGILPGIMACCNTGRQCVIPAGNAEEAGLINNIGVSVCPHLLDLCSHLKGESSLKKTARPIKKQIPPEGEAHVDPFSDIVGQFQAKRALTIAAGGGHNILMRGPPGTGKTMLANRLCRLLPPLDERQAMEVAAVQSISNERVDIRDCFRVPFRAPHHTSSAVAMVGGGKNINPGEITRAHHGVLFLDELPEFSPRVLESLREPMESGAILVSRASYQARLPADFQLIAAMNPCPCGFHGDPERECRCSEEKIRHYQHRVSGPLLDRIDMHVEVPRLNSEEKALLLTRQQPVKAAASPLAQVITCRKQQLLRAGKINARLEQADMRRYCSLGKEEKLILDKAMEQLKLSTRAYFRILKIARTIADFSNSAEIKNPHLLEAINYRKFDRPS